VAERKIVTVLEPTDEYTHVPDESSNYNESMYLNGFDLERQVGGWFRLGNRVNEGYAEMTVCLYLPGRRVGFMYQRPQISTNDEMRAGGLHIEVIEPFQELRVMYEGDVCLLDEPLQMANPRQAFRDNPRVACTVDLTMRGISPMYGGKAVYDDGTEIPVDPEKSFAKAHYEQHTAVTGVITVGDEVIELDGYGLRDKSWGPRYWQAITWYRWLPIMFGPDLAMMLSVIGDPDGGEPRQGGMVFKDGEYHRFTSVEINSDFDDLGHQTAMRCVARTTDGDEFEVTGEVLSLIPLRNRRATPDGDPLVTRITEAMTKYQCGEYAGIGMSEYLDQVIDGRPIGPDVDR
jgi:hypothetical protein